jgi:hypothetical protein
MRNASQGLWQSGGSSRDLSRDHALDPAREPPLGAHLVTPRRKDARFGFVSRNRGSSTEMKSYIELVRSLFPWRNFARVSVD